MKRNDITVSYKTVCVGEVLHYFRSIEATLIFELEDVCVEVSYMAIIVQMSLFQSKL